MVINNLNSSSNQQQNSVSASSSLSKLTKMLQNPQENNVNSSCNNNNNGNKSNVLSNEDKKINLNALKNHDPFATNILDMAVRVAVYKFLSKKNEWKKLDVEGSLFLFERMVEPLHSFVVMNTLALNLFLQPVTQDLEFQDRNPFLLYKSNNDIFGIWFIDKEDCERIKTLLNSLIENAKERRLKREQSKISTQQSLQSILSNSNSNLVTPLSLLTMSASSTNLNVNKESTTSTTIISNSQETNSKNSIDIIQMLNKAQLQYNHSKSLNLEPTSHSTPGGLNLLFPTSLTSATSMTSSDPNEPKPISQWPTHQDLFLNSNQFIKPEPIRQSTQFAISPSSLSTGSMDSTNPPHRTKSQTTTNPILQLLLPSNTNPDNNNNNTSINSSTITLNQSTNELASASAQELFSLDLKRKLNIQSNNNNNNKCLLNNFLNSPIIGASPSMIITPSSNPLILAPNSLQQTRPMTVQDFEENLLNQSTHSTPTAQNADTNELSKVNSNNTNIQFYLANDSTSPNNTNNTTSSDYQLTTTRPVNLTFNNNSKRNQKIKLSSLNISSSSSSCSSSSSSSSSSESDSEPSSPNGLPLLLTPAAFESSSASSTTSSSFNQNNADENAQTQAPISNAFGNFLFPTQFTFDFSNSSTEQNTTNTTTTTTTTNSKTNTSNQNVNNNYSSNETSSLKEMSLLSKAQLQQVLIHLLNTDDQFLNSLHQAYLKSNAKPTKTQSTNTEKECLLKQNNNTNKNENTKPKSNYNQNHHNHQINKPKQGGHSTVASNFKANKI